MLTSLVFVSHVILNMYACGFVSLTSITQCKHCKSQNDFVFIRGIKSCIKGLGALHKGSPFVSFLSLQLDFYCTMSVYACCFTNSSVSISSVSIFLHQVMIFYVLCFGSCHLFNLVRLFYRCVFSPFCHCIFSHGQGQGPSQEEEEIRQHQREEVEEARKG